MTIGLPAVGTLKYNGYTFDGTSKVTVRIEFVKDEAQRTIIYHKHVITVRATIGGITQSPSGAPIATDETMEDIRARLGEQGAILEFTNRGFGEDLIVNKRGGIFDVKWGPVPEILMWEPIGSNNACEIEWQVTVHVPHCVKGKVRTKGIMATNYEVVFEIDRRGATTRTITGYLEIAQTRNKRKIPDTADAYREVIAPEPPAGYRVGFERTTSQWNVSKDKSRVDFTVIDRQIPSPNAYPRGAIEISAKHRVVQRRKSMRPRNVITVDIERATDISGSMTWMIFLQLVGQRIKHAQRKGSVLIIDEVSVEEDIFGYESSFRVSYQYTSCLKDLIGNSGLWMPVEGTDWGLWRASMASTMFNHTGSAGLRNYAANDAIIDLCGVSTSALNAPVRSTREQTVRASTIENKKPPAKESWYEYDAAIIPYRERPVVRQSILQPEESYIPGGMTESEAASLDFNFGAAGGTSDIMQTGGRPRYGARFVGSALRVGHKIPRPALRTIGGQTAQETRGAFLLRPVSNLLGIPLWSAKWVIDYVLSNSPGKVTPPDKLDECISGKKADKTNQR